MATGSWPTLLDVSTRLDPKGEIPEIAELLSQTNEMNDDIPYVEANGKTRHEFVFRTSIPGGYYRSYNQGVPYSKSTTGKASVAVASLQDYSQVDMELAEDSGNPQAFCESEDMAFLEGMSQTVAETFMYGNSVSNPSAFMGLASFYNTINPATAKNATNVINAGGTGASNTSMWLCCWSPRTLYGVYPERSKAGLTMEDKGQTVPAYDSLGNRFEAYTVWFRQRVGLCPQDWRYTVRIANIDTTAAGLAGPNAPDLFALMAEAVILPPALGKLSGINRTDAPRDPGSSVRPVWYCNRTSRHWMDIQSMRNRNVLQSINDYAGNPTTGWRGVPIKIVDQILVTESALT
jgi:hypothetical protein